MSPLQFTVARFVLGTYLAVHFSHLAAERLAVGVLMVASVLFALGVWRRVQAEAILAVWIIAGGFFRSEIRDDACLIAALVLLCACVPSGEPAIVPSSRKYARWNFPAWIHGAAWIALAAAYAIDAALHIASSTAQPLSPITWTVVVLELGFVVLAAFARMRGAVWLVLLAVQIALAFRGNATTPAFLLAHLFTFDRRWLAPRSGSRMPVLLFDGECGLCSAVVRLLLREDTSGRIRFAALQSAPAQNYLREKNLPHADFQSLVFVPDWNDRTTSPSFRTTGVSDVLDEIGGLDRVASWLRIIPAPIRDVAYRVVARVRFAIFGRPREDVRALPEAAGRFLDTTISPAAP